MERRSEPSANTDTPLRFKPLSEGLGFHPFSDGLPYSPINQSGRTVGAAPTTVRTPSAPLPAIQPSPLSAAPMGSGATAAGPARPAVPLSRQPRTATPFTPPLSTPTPSPAPLVAPYAKARPQVEPPLVLTEAKLGFLYLIRRSIAWTVDSSIHLSLGALTLALSLESQGIALDAILRSDAWIAAALFLLGFNWALILAQEVAFGTSLGKRLCRLEIEGSAAALFVRAFFFIPSQLLFGLGLIWALFDGQKLCWHDRVAEVQPLPIQRY